MTENIRDLSKFGLREIGIAAELLTKYSDGPHSWASNQDALSDDIAMEFQSELRERLPRGQGLARGDGE